MRVRFSAPRLLDNLKALRDKGAAEPWEANLSELANLTAYDPMQPSSGHRASMIQASAIRRRDAIMRTKVAPIVHAVLTRTVEVLSKRVEALEQQEQSTAKDFEVGFMPSPLLLGPRALVQTLKADAQGAARGAVPWPDGHLLLALLLAEPPK